MTRQLYVELYNLITDSQGNEIERAEDYLNLLDKMDNDDDRLFETVNKIKAHRRKAREYDDLLKRFGEEIEEPLR